MQTLNIWTQVISILIVGYCAVNWSTKSNLDRFFKFSLSMITISNIIMVLSYLKIIN